jgi:hypothetical protein
MALQHRQNVPFAFQSQVDIAVTRPRGGLFHAR